MKKKILFCLIAVLIAASSVPLVLLAFPDGQAVYNVQMDEDGCCSGQTFVQADAILQGFLVSQFLIFLDNSDVQPMFVYEPPTTRGVAEGFYVLANYQDVMDLLLIYFDNDIELIEAIIGAPLTPHSVACIFGHSQTTWRCNIKVGLCHDGACQFEARDHSWCARCQGNRWTSNRNRMLGCLGRNWPRNCPDGFLTLF